jgi:hypothetical protein
LYSTGRLDHNTPQSLINEFLEKGGKITICPPGSRTEDIEYTGGFYGKRKKKPAPDVTEEIDDDES